jgi:hypothetical protein
MTTSMKEQWVHHCLDRARTPAEFYTGCRKIHTGVQLTFDQPFAPVMDSRDLERKLLCIEDAGFTNTKLGMLRRLYWDDEHAEKVAELWRGRVERNKYGSVSVSTYHHITKSDPTKRSKRASVMGPCLVGVAFTLLDSKKNVSVDAFYRTTELFKKFPADLVFIRDTIVPAIGVEPARVVRLRCHFANVTSHPMYAVTWLPHLDDMLVCLDSLKKTDQRFFDWTIKWTGRYVCPEYHRGIAKFAQALRVQKDALNRITGKKLKKLQEYIRDNHPGYRGDYDENDEDGDE